MSTVLYVRVPEELHDQATRIAEEHCTSLTQLVARALAYYFKAEFGWEPKRSVASLP